MRKIFYIFLVVGISLFSFTSCEKEIKDLSTITYYVDLKLNGEEQMWVELNTPFEDPGFTATENDEDVSSKVEVTGNVETDKVGYYPISYTVTNKDGFVSSETREVFVYDSSVDVDYSGTYVVNGKRTTPSGTDNFSDFTINITQMNPGFYTFSDFLGGYYSQGKGYGEITDLSGYASISSDGTVLGLYSYVSAWGDSASSISGTVNEDQSIDMVVEYAGMLFEYKLTKE